MATASVLKSGLNSKSRSDLAWCCVCVCVCCVCLITIAHSNTHWYLYEHGDQFLCSTTKLLEVPWIPYPALSNLPRIKAGLLVGREKHIGCLAAVLRKEAAALAGFPSEPWKAAKNGGGNYFHQAATVLRLTEGSPWLTTSLNWSLHL